MFPCELRAAPSLIISLPRPGLAGLGWAGVLTTHCRRSHSHTSTSTGTSSRGGRNAAVGSRIFPFIGQCQCGVPCLRGGCRVWARLGAATPTMNAAWFLQFPLLIHSPQHSSPRRLRPHDAASCLVCCWLQQWTLR